MYFWLQKNKRAGYHRHILRLPNLVKMQFQNKKTFFPRKKHLFFIIFSNFSNVRIFCFFLLPKNLIMRAEKTFIRNNTIWYEFYSKFATVINFEKKSIFFQKTHLFFQKKTHKFWTFWEILLFQQQIWNNFFKKIDFQTREQPILDHLRKLNWQTSKKTHLFERKILLSIFSIWCKIIKVKKS